MNIAHSFNYNWRSHFQQRCDVDDAAADDDDDDDEERDGIRTSVEATENQTDTKLLAYRLSSAL